MPMKIHFLVSYCLLLVGLWPVAAMAQSGAWSPPNADLTYPRTLFKSQEVPDVQQYLLAPEIHGLYTRLYNGTNGFQIGNMNVNGPRRQAAHAAKNAAFILLLDRKPMGSGLDTLTDVEADGFRDKAIFLLESMNTNVETYPDFGNYLWRSNEIVDNMIAYDLLKGAGVHDSLLTNARALLQEFAGNLHEQIAFNTFGLGLFGLHVDNHSIRSAAAIALSAIVLNDATSNDADERPINWINTAMYNIDNVLWRDGERQSEPGIVAGYAEGPHYLRFGFKHMLPMIHAFGNFLPDTTITFTFDGDSRGVRNPWYDPNYENLWEWVVKIRMPDGRHPALEDCFIATCYPELAIMEDPRYRTQIAFSRWHPLKPNSLWEQLHHSSDDVTADFIASRTTAMPDVFPGMLAMKESGNLVFRSGWDTTDTYLHITAKNGNARINAKGHNHADVSSFILHAHGQLLALDPGYLRWDRRDEVSEADNHNMLLVDGEGPADGNVGAANGADGYITEEFDLRHLDYARVGTNYKGAAIFRRPMFIRDNYFVFTDVCTDNQAHDYAWRLHGYGLEGGDSIHGTFVLEAGQQRGIWRKNGVNLLAQVSAVDGADMIGKETNIHELRFDSMETHTTMIAERTNATAATFVSALIPFVTDSPVVRNTCSPCGGLVVEQGGYTDAFFAGGMATATSTGFASNLESDATLAFYSEDSVGDFSQLMVVAGSFLKWTNSDIVRSTNAMNIALSVLDSCNYEGHVSDTGEVYFYDLAFVPGSVHGFGVVDAWNWNAGMNRLEIRFKGAGRFTILKDVVAGAGAAPQATDMLLFPNPAVHSARMTTHQASGTVHIYDLRGNRLQSKPFGNYGALLPLSDLSAGIYLVAMHDASGRRLATKKLVVRAKE